MRRLSVVLSVPVLTLAMMQLPARAADRWRAYTGVNQAHDVAVGPHLAWFAADGGLVWFDKGAGRWHRATVDEGVPALDVMAVAVEPRDDRTAWFVCRDLYSRQTWVGRYRADGRASARPVPAAGRLPAISARLLLGPASIRLVELDYQGGVWSLRGSRDLRQWRTEPLTEAQKAALRRRFREPLAYGVWRILPAGRSVWLFSSEQAAEWRAGVGRLAEYKLPFPGGQASRSTPFRVRADAGGLRYSVIVSRAQAFPNGATVFARELLAYRLDRRAGEFVVAARRAVPEGEVASLTREVTRDRSGDGMGNELSINALAADRDALWLAGGARLARWDRATRRITTCPPFPHELSLGQNLLIQFRREDGRLVVGANNMTERVYDPRSDSWLSRPQRTQPPLRWAKVALPSSPAPGEAPKEMWGLIAYQDAHWRWLLFGEGLVGRVPQFSGPFTQPPARVDRRTGKVRFFSELWGWHAEYVAPFGDGSAWLVCRFVEDSGVLKARYRLYRYDGPRDRLALATDFTPFAEPTERLDWKQCLMAADARALFAYSSYLRRPPAGKEGAVLAWTSARGTWEPVALPAGSGIQQLFGEAGVLAARLSGRGFQRTLWLLSKDGRKLDPLALPSRYAGMQPWSLAADDRWLWVGGLYVVRGPR